MEDLEQYAALVRPAIDRVYVGVRAAARDRCRQIVADVGVPPGLVGDVYFGLLAGPMPADAVQAVCAYHGDEMTPEREAGVLTVDEAGAWHLTEAGRQLGLRIQQAIADAAAESWERRPIATMPGLAALPVLADLLGTLLAAGRSSGGAAFNGVTPVFEPSGASSALQVTTRLGALRHHRGDAHRAAWRGAGLTMTDLLALAPDDDVRRAVEDETNRRDAPIYAALTPSQRWRFLAVLAALP